MTNHETAGRWAEMMNGWLNQCSLACVWAGYMLCGCADAGDAGQPRESMDGACGSGCDAKQIAVGGTHACVLLRRGTVRCWGITEEGGLGYQGTDRVGIHDEPVAAGDVDVGASVVQIAAGGGFTCALTDAHEVRCWGSNTWGQLGYGHTETVGDDEAPASAGSVNVGGRVEQIALGGSHACVLLDDARVRCWGLNGAGQLGYGNTETIGDDEQPASAGDVEVGGNVLRIATGASHTCALLATGDVRCWGAPTYGALGDGSRGQIAFEAATGKIDALANALGDDELPTTGELIDVGGRVVDIAAGGNHACALLESGAVRCWGRNDSGQLGYGNTENVGDDETPASAGDVNVGGTVRQVAAGFWHTCALLDGGAVRCWGYADQGQLGYASTVKVGDDESPASAGDVVLGGVASSVSAGGVSCAVLDDGAVRCWGWGGSVGYGRDETIGDDETPQSAGNVPFR